MNNIAVGMSGGVDSSVTAFLLKEQGYQVTGIYLRMIDHPNADKASNDAKRVAEQIGIDFKEYDIRKEFKEKIINYFTESYLTGITPNPCVVCNREIKFRLFFELVEELGIKKIATGHYLSVEYEESINRFILKKAADLKKDQTYFLYYLNQAVLENVVFPLGKYEKEEVKKIAEKAGLHIAQKDESQEICFIPDNDYKKFLKDHYGEKAFTKGPIIDQNGKKVGEHQGLPFYTIGQRKGIGLSLEYPAYVTGYHYGENKLFIGTKDDLFSNTLTADQVHLLHLDSFDPQTEYDIKIRYSNHTSKGKVQMLDDKKITVIFTEPQRAITPGQSVVFYQGDILIGGGIIQ